MHGSFIPIKVSTLSSDSGGLFGVSFGGSVSVVSGSGGWYKVLGAGRVHGKAAANASCGDGGEEGSLFTECRAGEEISLVGSDSATLVLSFSFVEKAILAACRVTSVKASTVVPIRDWNNV